MSTHHLIGHRYRIQDTLGQGGMGIVYRGDDRLTGETIALKRVLLKRPPLLLTALIGFARYRFQLRQAKHSAELLGLAAHPPALDAPTHDQRLKPLRSELKAALSSYTLRAALKHGKSLDLDAVVAEILADTND